MKKRIFAILLCLLLLLCGCSKADYAIKVGDRTVTENDYYRTMSILRSNYLSADSEATDTKEYWASAMDNGKTLSETTIEVVQDHLIKSKLYALQFDKLGLSFTAEEESAIQNALSQTVEGLGGMSKFNAYLQQTNYTYDEFLEEQFDTAKKSKVLSYYYGADGQKPVKLQDIKDYYNVHNALVKAVTILKVDKETGEKLSADELKKVAQKAEDAYNAAITPADTDTFEDVIAVYGSYSDDTDSFIVNDSEGETELVKQILEMKVGEVLKLENDDSYYVFKRYDGTADDVFTASIQLATLETIRADEIETMLEEWYEAADIKINKKIVKKYRPEKMIQE
ncbi:MAG: hypothetical protein IKM48_04780 [Clostridia bacterium]|nr:hypothetical protein [Clostridia bacterium]